MKKLLLLALLAVLGFGTAIAQEVEIPEVTKRGFRGVQAIIDKKTDESLGFYTTYVSERAGMGKREFIIAIYDLNLKLVKETPVVMGKNSSITSSAFNGEDFLFMFTDYKFMRNTYVTVTKEGEVIKKQDVQEKRPESLGADVFPAQNGFYIARLNRDKRVVGYIISKMDRDQNTLWEVNLAPGRKGYNDIEHLEVVDDKLIALSVDFPKKRSDKGNGVLTCFADADGKQLWSYELFDGTNQHIPSAFLIDEAGDLVAGGMYFDGPKWDNNDAVGIFTLKLDQNSGELKKMSEQAWDKEIQKVLKTTASMNIGKPKVFFEEIVEKDGGYQLIGETFRTTIKAAQAVAGGMSKMGGFAGMAGGIAKMGMKAKTQKEGRYIGDINADDDVGLGSALAGSISFDIEDWVIANFDKELNLTKVKMVDKDKLSIMTYPPYTFQGGIKLAKIIQDHGFFQYKFKTSVPGVSEQVIVSSDMTKDPYIGFTDISGEEIGETKELPVKFRAAHMSSKNNDSYVGALKAAPGKVCIYYYVKPEKTIVMYLEDIKL